LDVPQEPWETETHPLQKLEGRPPEMTVSNPTMNR